MKEKAKAERVGLILSEERSGEYYHVILRAVLLTGPDGDTVRNGLDSPWDGLEIRCQGDNSTGPRVYGWECCYRNVYSIETDKAVRMAKTLTRIDKGLDRLNKARGYAHTYAEYVGRVCEVLGVEAILRTRKEQGWHDANEYQRFSIGHGRDLIEHMIASWAADVQDKNAA